MPLMFGRPSDATLARLAEAAATAPLTYADVGITRRPTSPTDLRIDHWSIDLGDDPGRFERACQALREWRAHRGAGARIVPEDAPLEVGRTVLVALGLPGFTAVAPCRIVWVVDEPDRFGFGYGTLPGHPERGEESFVIERTGNGVRFGIVAASRPAALLPRLGAPVTGSIHRHITNRYLTSLKASSSP